MQKFLRAKPKSFNPLLNGEFSQVGSWLSRNEDEYYGKMIAPATRSKTTPGKQTRKSLHTEPIVAIPHKMEISDFSDDPFEY